MNIYVGNLSGNVSDQELREVFEAFGEVTTVSIIKDKISGKPRGFGFVEMPVKEEGLAAIEGLNGEELDGQVLSVNEARSRSERRGNRGHQSGQNGYGGSKSGYGGRKGKYSGGRGGRGGNR